LGAFWITLYMHNIARLPINVKESSNNIVQISVALWERQAETYTGSRTDP